MEHNPPVANGNTCYYRSMTSLKTLLNFFRPFVKQISNDGQKSTSNGHAASSARGEQRATKVIKKKLLMNFPSPLLTSAVVSIQPGKPLFLHSWGEQRTFPWRWNFLHAKIISLRVIAPNIRTRPKLHMPKLSIQILRFIWTAIEMKRKFEVL